MTRAFRLAGGLALATTATSAQTPAGVELALRRFFLLGDSVLVEGIARVPFVLLDALGGEEPGARGGGDAAYRFSVTVRDLGGGEVLRETWGRRVPGAELSTDGVEHIRFLAVPGRLRVVVTVTDSASGRVSRVEDTLTIPAAPPLVSDLLLAGGGEPATRASFAAAGWPAFGPRHDRVAYYAEVYPRGGLAPDADSIASVTVRIVDSLGRALLGGVAGRAVTSPVRLSAGLPPTALHGAVELTGLPPGRYRLDLLIRAGRDTAFRSAPFQVLAAARAPAAAPPDRFFESLSEGGLDSLYGPLLYLMQPDERGAYSALPADRKRDWLRRFWARRDPTPGTPRNEARDDFYARIASADRDYREGGAAQIPGWRTDRGRIFIRYGAPDEVLRRPQPDYSLPYEAWKYTRGRRLKFVFVDLTRFGNYALVYTNDLREVSRPGWWSLMGSRAAEEVLRF